ncbi:MAG: DUF2785 domain-containing protein, partial [Ktedonobacteraceae bacterium]|nr:DUF2785 domain-containing protein [Ktedonobacteraceae bacterium]
MPDVKELATSKPFLRSIAENNYEIPPEIDSFVFAHALLANLASTDEELRDELSYMLLASGIIDRHRLTIEQVEAFLQVVLDKDHLFYCIGEAGTDSVFMRSFSSLIVAGIVYTDNRNPQLPAEDIHLAKDALLRYARGEKDWRGYVEGKGWAHAMAHLADALDECAQHQSMSAEDRQEILQTLSGLIKLPEPLYHEEDMRLAAIAFHIIACKQVSEEFLATWIASCYVERNSDVSVWMRASNAKNFLRSLYFLLFWDNMALNIVEQISDILKKQDEVYLAAR